MADRSPLVQNGGQVQQIQSGDTISPSWISVILSTISGWIDLITSTRGSILYRGASSWAGLSPDVSGKILTSQGTGADPIYKTPVYYPVTSILSTPPGTPAIGDRYIVGSSPTGAWAGQTNSIAEWIGSWQFTTPLTGWKTYVIQYAVTYQYTGTAWQLDDYAAYTIHPSGFAINLTTGEIDKGAATISTTDLTRTVSITPTGASFVYFVQGKRFVSTGASIQITNTEGVWYIYFDETGTIRATQTFSYAFILLYASITTVYWDATNLTFIYVGEGRHGCQTSPLSKRHFATATGATYVDGLALSGILPDQNGSLDSYAQFGVISGTCVDDDILLTFATVASTTGLPIFWKSGATGAWRRTIRSGFSVINTGTGRLAYNQFTGGVWQQTEVTNNDYVLYHVFATNDVNYPFFSIMGINDYNTVANARTGALTEVGTLTGLPFTHFVLLGTVIFQTSNGFSNTVKATIRSTDTGASYLDWRTSEITPSSAVSLSHNNLGGLYGVTPYYHSDQPIATTDVVTFAGLKLTDAANITTAGALNDVATTGTSSLRFTAATSISGFANGTNGAILYIKNANSVSLTLLNNNAGSSVGNRIYTGVGADIVLLTNASTAMKYDSTAGYWQVTGSVVYPSTGKTTPIDADEMTLIDSAASNALKYVTWANLKATLKTYFDTLYAASTQLGRIGIFGELIAPTNVLYFNGSTGLARASYPALWTYIFSTHPEWSGADSRYSTTSSTSATIASSGSFSMTVGAGLSYFAGQRVRMWVTNQDYNYVEGVVTSYSGTSLVFTADTSSGSGTFTTWTFVCADKTLFGYGNGATTFSIPDFRGLAMRIAGTHATLAMANGTKYTGGALLSTLLDQMQGWQAGADHDITGPRTYYGVINQRDYTQTAGPYAGASDLAMITTGQGISNMIKAVNDGTNGSPRTGAETRMATVSINIGIYYA